jgi:hypothetical protein
LAQAGEEYGLYVYAVDGQWNNPCQIEYRVGKLGTRELETKAYRLLSKSRQKDELEQLKRLYSRDGFDKPDFRFKLQSCKHWRVVQSHQLHAPEKKNSPDVRASVEEKSFYLKIEINHHAYGYWTHSLNVTERNTSGYVRLRQLRCFIGPMSRLQANAMEQRIRADKQLLKNALGNKMENDMRGFVHRGRECLIQKAML